MPFYIIPPHTISSADDFPDRKVYNNGIRKIRSIYKNLISREAESENGSLVLQGM